MPTIPLLFSASPLPANFKGTPQQFLDAIVSRLSAESPTPFSTFSSGSTAPTSDQGPFWKDNQTWYYWDTITGSYQPAILEDVQRKYIASASAPDQTKFTFWIELVAGVPQAIKYFYGGSWQDIYKTQLDLIRSKINKFCASAKPGSDQTIAIDTNSHKITFDQAFINPDSAYNAGLARYVCPVAGIYRVTANCQVDNDSGVAASMELAIDTWINGGPTASTPASGTAVASPPGSRWYPQVDGLVSAAANDYLEMAIRATDGTNSGNITVSTNSQFFVELVQPT